jgi:hypothetical protein
MAGPVRYSYPAFPGFPAPPIKALAYRNGTIIDYDLQDQKVTNF